MNWDSWTHQSSGELEVLDTEKAHLLGSKPKVPSPVCLAPVVPIGRDRKFPLIGQFAFPEQLFSAGQGRLV